MPWVKGVSGLGDGEPVGQHRNIRGVDGRAYVRMKTIHFQIERPQKQL
jgi:hypothetical protein